MVSNLPCNEPPIEVMTLVRVSSLSMPPGLEAMNKSVP